MRGDPRLGPGRALTIVQILAWLTTSALLPASSAPAQTAAATPTATNSQRSDDPAAGDPAAGDPAAGDPAQAHGVWRIDLELDRDTITVGDPIRAELTLVWMGAEPSAPPRFPTWQETWGKAEVLEVGDVEHFVDASGRSIHRQVLTLTAFTVGEIDLPPLTFAIPLGDATEALQGPEGERFTVTSVLPPEAEPAAGDPAAGDPAAGDPAAGDPAAGDPAVGDNPEGEPLEPRPAAPPIRLAANMRAPWLIATLALATLLSAALLSRRLDRLPVALAGGGISGRPLLPPLDELHESLDGVDLAAGSEPAHTALSLALRRYLGRRLGFQAVESTTSEIQRHCRQLPLSGDEARELVRLLRDCDAVKFARLEVSAMVSEERLGRARRLAETIEGHFLPRVTSGDAVGGPGAAGEENAA